MKSNWGESKQFTIAHEHGFYVSLPALLRGCLCICMAWLLISCASVPTQTYINNTSLSGISKVAVVVSANSPEVTHSLNQGGAEVISQVILGPIGFLLAKAARSGEDNESGARIRERVDLSRLEENMSQSFMQPLIKASCFETMEFMGNSDQKIRKISTENYDAIIKLSVRDISIRTFAGDYVKIHALVHGQMKNLHSGDILWDREEYISSSEPKLVSFYREHGLKELDGMLEKATRLLSNDFVYHE